MAAKLRIHLGAVQSLNYGVPKLRIFLGAVQVLWADEIYWGCDFTMASSFEVDLTVGSPPYPPVVGRWTWAVTERLIFHTEILQSHNRTEQRIAKRRGVPEHRLSARLWIEGEWNSARLDAVLHTWLKRTWRVPVWSDAEAHRGPLAAASTVIPIDTRYSDFSTSFARRNCLIWQNAGTYEFGQIDAKTDSSLTLQAGLSNSYTGHKWVVPVRIGRLIDAALLERTHDGGLIAMTFRIEDVEAMAGFTAVMTYDDYTVLTDPAVLVGDSGRFSHAPDIAILDAGTGPFEIVSNSDFNEVTQSHGWRPWTKAACWWLRQLLYDIKGRQQAFLVPTFKQDIELTRPVAANATTLYCRNSDLIQMGANAMRTYVAFRPAGSDIIVRKVTDISLVSAAEELITIDASPEQAFAAAEHLCWVDKCRLASDEIELTWSGIGKLSTDTPLIRVTN